MYNKEEKIYNKLKESIIKENEMPYNIENDKRELLDSISPLINDTLQNKEESNILKYNINSPKIKNEEYFDYKAKKLKLINLYNQLLEFRKKLIIKEIELNKKEKNLIEFEKVLKSNEAILKSNIEQFEIYIKNNINEIKSQFNQIEKIQNHKENYLKQKEEEIINFKNKSISLQNSSCLNCNNNNTHIMCNCDLCNEEKIIKPFIDNYLAEIEANDNDSNNSSYKKLNNYGKNNLCSNGYNNQYKKCYHQKNNSVNYMMNNSNFINFKKNYIGNNNNKKKYYKRLINNTAESQNDFVTYHYTCTCPGCNFCSL